MGCKESKHRAVAEGNTIITRSSSRKSMSRGHSSIKSNVSSFQRSRSTRSSIQKQDSLKKINVGVSKASNVMKANENSGYDKGTVNVSKVLENEDRRLKELNDRIAKSNDKELIQGKDDVGVETNAEQEKENENGNFLISLSRKDGEGIESIITDGLSGTSVYYTPTEPSGPFANNTKADNDEEKQESFEEKQVSKQESIEEINNTQSEGAAEDNTIKTVDATDPMNDVEEAEVAENDDLTPENQEKEAEVAEKIKVAEAAIAALESLVKEADKTEDNDAAIQNAVKEAEEILVAEGEMTDATLEKPVIEADKSDIIQQTESESTDTATLQNPEQEADKSEDDIREIEPEATDATLPYPVIESDKVEESLLKDDAEAGENGVKEIHEVADKAEEIPAKEPESTDPTDHKKQEMVANKTEDVQEEEAEAAYANPEDSVKEVEVADQVQNSAEDVSIHEENPVKDEANTEEDTENSSTANVHQISTEDPDNK